METSSLSSCHDALARATATRRECWCSRRHRLLRPGTPSSESERASWRRSWSRIACSRRARIRTRPTPLADGISSSSPCSADRRQASASAHRWGRDHAPRKASTSPSRSCSTSLSPDTSSRSGHRPGEEVMAGIDAHAATDARPFEAATAVTDEAARRMGREMDTRGSPALLHRNLDHPRWDDVAARCLSCGNCTNACPTCFCSDDIEVEAPTAHRRRASATGRRASRGTSRTSTAAPSVRRRAAGTGSG